VIDRLHLPVTLDARTAPVVLRRATRDDLAGIVRLLADDPVSASRGDRAQPEDEAAYAAALDAITADAGNDLLVAVAPAGVVVGTLQVTVIPGLTRRGSTRLLVEAVRVASTERSSGIGTAVMRWVTDVAAPAVGATLVQLTSDAARSDAHRFYRRLGFVDSHVGFKHAVGPAPTSASMQGDQGDAVPH